MDREKIIEEMVAGRVIDLHVAEKVMGWRLFEDPRGRQFTIRDEALRPKGSLAIPWHELDYMKILLTKEFSTKIEAAWQVLEKMYIRSPHAKVLRIWKWDAFQDGRVHHRGPWACQYGEGHQFEYGDTAPLAICRAALAAVEREERHDTTD